VPVLAILLIAGCAEAAPEVRPGAAAAELQVVPGEGEMDRAAEGADTVADVDPGSAVSADSPSGAIDPAAGDPPGAEVVTAPDVSAETATPAAATPAPDQGPPPSFTRPEHIRGIYLNAWASGSVNRREALMDLARRTEINTFVIDVKDATGYISYPTGVELAREIGADREIRIRTVRLLMDRLAEEGIYPIARIVVFKDHLLAEKRPDMAVRDSTGAPWVDGRGDVWVNPWDERVWAYHAAIAREAVEMGFPEIQWDYVRFPDRPASEMATAVFPGADGRTRSHAIREFLIWTDRELADLGVPLTADVFGMATSATTDVGIGQLWEDLADVTDALLPMVYPSHYWKGSFGIAEPNDDPYEVVGAALRHAVRRNAAIEGPARIIPWLQDFTLGAPRYEGPQVRAQIQATYDAGIQEWILWNASGRYTEAALEPVGGWPGGVGPALHVPGRVTEPAPPGGS